MLFEPVGLQGYSVSCCLVKEDPFWDYQEFN
jgi:hypothetical protein